MRTSLLAAIVGVHAFQGTRYTVAGEVPRAQGNHHPSISPYGLFNCADGTLQIAVGNDLLWQRFAVEFGLDPKTEGFATNAERVGNRDALIAAVNAAFAEHTLADLLPRLEASGIPAGEVRALDSVYEWEQTRSQGLVIDVDHPVLGMIELPGPPIRFDDLTYAGGRSTHLPPPALGEHSQRVRNWLDQRDGGDRGDGA